MEVFAAAATSVQNGIPCAMVTVIHASGSTPRSQGARMLVYADGRIVGSIGGGDLERKVISIAQASIANHNHIRYSSRHDVEQGMSCAVDMELYIEPLCVHTPLYLFGAGHVAYAVASLLRTLRFGVSVIDARESLLTKERFPNVTRHLVDPVHFARTLPSTEQSYFILMTHRHDLDGELARILIQKPHAWLGILGSIRKIDGIRQALQMHGIPDEHIGRLQAPIGLNIGAKNPQEIAISIVAQLIAHRSQTPFPIQSKSKGSY